MSGPLDGIVVVDLSRALAGPHAAMMLGDLGARVIKVENPGTATRRRGWGPPFVGPDDDPASTYFLSCNRNKESVTLDLKSDDGRDAADPAGRRRPTCWSRTSAPACSTGSASRVERLHELNPRPGRALDQRVRPRRARGRPGRLRPDRAGRGGLMSLTGAEPSTPQRVGVPIGDLLAGHVRRVRRGRRAARAQPHRQGPGRAHVAAGLDRRGARLPGHALHRRRRGGARPGQPPPVDLPLRPVPLRRRAGADRPAAARASGAGWRRGLRPRPARARVRHQPRAGPQPGRGDRGARRGLRRHPARRAAGRGWPRSASRRARCAPSTGSTTGTRPAARACSSTSSTRCSAASSSRARRCASTHAYAGGRSEHRHPPLLGEHDDDGAGLAGRARQPTTPARQPRDGP